MLCLLLRVNLNNSFQQDCPFYVLWFLFLRSVIKLEVIHQDAKRSAPLSIKGLPLNVPWLFNQILLSRKKKAFVQITFYKFKE